MKKKILLFTVVLAMLLSLSVVLAACGDNVEKTEYQVTVLNADSTPLSDITVSWNSGGKSAGSAVTDSNGVAKVTLPAANYNVTLSGLAEGMLYDDITVGSILSKVTITLKIERVLYSVSVTDKSGNAAAGVTVSWLKGDNYLAGTAVTGSNGKAELEMDYGTYGVTLNGLPAGNILDVDADEYVATGKAPDVSIALVDGVTVAYSVTLKTEGGLAFDNQSVYVMNRNGKTVAIDKTDENGVFVWSAVASDYTVRASGLPAGFSASDVVAHADERDVNMTVYSSVISSIPTYNNFRYYMGDIIHDYKFTVPYLMEGEKTNRTYSIAEILKTKKAVFINNWGINCSACIQEMPYMQDAYEKYKDDIEILAVSNFNGGDSNTAISNFYRANSYTFPMMRDSYNFTSKFGIEGWPTTVIIDRYGAIARIEKGGLPYAEVWETLIERYIGDDYVQTFKRGESISDSITSEISKPDFEVDPDHYDKINASVLGLDGAVTWFASKDEYAWPYMYDVVEGISATDDEKVLYASNSGKGNTTAVIYAYVQIPAGKVFTFDYYCQTENLDVLSVYWDGQVVQEIAGSDPTWRTYYLFSELASGRHLLAFTYAKDPALDVGKDNVFIKNVRFAEISEIPEGTDMLRAAAYGIPETGATQYPHYAGVAIDETDGYYHVNLSSLQNSEYAGADPKPMLFANLMTATNWSSNSISALVTGTREEDGEYAVDCNFTVNGEEKDWRAELTEYCKTASSSDLYGLIPVDKEFYDLLTAFMARVKETFNEEEDDKKLRDENEWLEICYFYSHYGDDGKFIGSPIIGLTEKTAINVNDILNEKGEWEADLTRVMYPFPVTIYAYTAPESGLYRIQSLIPTATGDEDQKGAQVWLYNDESGSEEPLIYSGDSRFIRDGVNEHNFDIYRYMYANEKYYIAVAFLNTELGTYDCRISKVEGESATVLEPCSANVFELVVDENGNTIYDENGDPSLILSGAIEYEYDETEDRYYALKSDGSRDGLIYLDVKYALAFSRFSLSVLVDTPVQDPADFTSLDYTMFDFRYRVAYFTQDKIENGVTVPVINYNPKMSLTSYGAKYKDCTAIMKGYITEALKAENDGLIPVNKEIKEILELFLETRLNMLLDGVQDTVLENEWLRFCWYYRTYDESSR